MSDDQTIIPAAEVVLVGGGHGHVEVIRSYLAQKQKTFRLSLINQTSTTPYSAMLPGLVAGHFRHDEAHIDLGHLCHDCGVRFIRDSVTGLDTKKREIELKNCIKNISYDTLSFDIGARASTPQLEGITTEPIAIKPVKQFLSKIADLEDEIDPRSASNPLRLAVVGGNISAVEIILALAARWQKSSRTLGKYKLSLIDQNEGFTPCANKRANKLILKHLQQAAISTHFASKISPSSNMNTIELSDGTKVECDYIIWTAAPKGPSWLAETGLELDESGLIKVNENLESSSHEGIYATGDIASLTRKYSLSNTGVYLNRIGTVLASNISRRFHGMPQIPYTPDKLHLSLIPTGNRTLICNLGGVAFSSKRLWNFKNALDLNWIEKYQKRAQKARIATFIESGRISVEPCSAAGSTLPHTILNELSESKEFITKPSVEESSGAPHAIDYLRSFTPDLYLFGKTVAVHCMNNLHAMGAKVKTAQVSSCIPFGPHHAMRHDLLEMLTGVNEILSKNEVKQTNARSLSGKEAGCGLLVQGDADAIKSTWKNSNIETDDALILTKPLGSGILLAAHAQYHLSTKNLHDAFSEMTLSHQEVIEVCRKHGVHAATAVNGYGLAVNLKDMLKESGKAATINIETVSIYNGVLRALSSGIRSSLHIQNRLPFTTSLQGLRSKELLLAEILFDPQTAGGLLMAIPKDHSEELIDDLITSGFHCSSVIGHVRSHQDDTPQILITL